MQGRRQNHLNVVLPCILVILVMLGLVAASPALYQLFSELSAPAATATGTTVNPASGQ
jgi:cytochrome c oxidase assembly protein Cox11